MKPSHILLALLTTVIWGLSFIATRYGVEEFSPAQLTFLRFLTACLPVFFLKRPNVPLRSLVLLGLFWFMAQFLFLFWAFQEGMLPGLASVTQQTNVFFTVLLAAFLLNEYPTRKQLAGMTVAMVGLALIGMSVGADLPLVALGLTLCAALSWAAGNIVVKDMVGVPMVSLCAWMGLVPLLPTLALSFWLDDQSPFHALADASWAGILSIIYLGTLSTIGGYAAWGYLLARYPSATVTPFALLVPCTGIISSVLVFNESFPPMRMAGIALIMVGLAIIILKWQAPALKDDPPAIPPA